ncbi:MAG: hypothetical protein ABIQ93_03195 [Saprospiraceae bacterium]
MGNERGLIETETNWCTLDTAGYRRGLSAPPNDTLNQGNVKGALWMPAECDVSIRPAWFYHPQEDSLVKTLAGSGVQYNHWGEKNTHFSGSTQQEIAVYRFGVQSPPPLISEIQLYRL